MKHTEIEAIMTAKVQEYIEKGYILSTATMSGHQGEIAKVDVKKGNEIIRILLIGGMDWMDEGTLEKTSLIVGRAQEKVRKSRPFDTMCSTIWNNKLDIIEQRDFYSVDSRADNFSENKEEIVAQHKKQIERYRNRRDDRYEKIKGNKAAEIALRFVRKQNRCGRTKITDIKEIRRYEACSYSKMHYTITLNNGKCFKLA